jgi:hypothetical protein
MKSELIKMEIDMAQWKAKNIHSGIKLKSFLLITYISLIALDFYDLFYLIGNHYLVLISMGILIATFIFVFTELLIDRIDYQAAKKLISVYEEYSIVLDKMMQDEINKASTFG